MEYVTLNNGVKCPSVGIGTFMIALADAEVSCGSALYTHQPAGNWLAGYRQLEKAYKDGKTKSIGICNFEGKYIDELEKQWEIVPQFIQVEAHPYFPQEELRKTLDKYDIKLMSWYPLGHGDKSLIGEQLAGYAAWQPEYERA